LLLHETAVLAQRSTAGVPLSLQVFGETPMADVEMISPEKIGCTSADYAHCSNVSHFCALLPVQVFGETPMADVEMIFPEKIVGIKPFQLVNLAVTVMTALVTGALVLWKVRLLHSCLHMQWAVATAC
jgi:hypothetical protein